MKYIDHLSKDKILAQLIESQGPVVLNHRTNIALYLCSSIMSQQLSVKVAAVIYQRFLHIFNGKEPTPADILNQPLSALRAIGLSNSKCSYVHNVATFASVNGMEPGHFETMTNEEVIEYLVPIKGVGRWTVEMLLMFALGREDVFAVDDLGIQHAMCKFYKISSADKKKMKLRMIKRSDKWSPYRTYACLHLWKSLATVKP